MIIKYLLNQDYYDVPDGEKCFKKTAILGGFATTFGVAGAMVHHVGSKSPKSLLDGAGKYAYFTAPLTLAAVTYGSVVCACTNFRKKDDYLNHIIASYASASVLGARFRSFNIGFNVGTLLAFATTIFKLCQRDGISMSPPMKPLDYGGFIHSYRDYTLVDEYSDVAKYENEHKYTPI